jgi:hypothetical protein
MADGGDGGEQKWRDSLIEKPPAKRRRKSDSPKRGGPKRYRCARLLCDETSSNPNDLCEPEPIP